MASAQRSLRRQRLPASGSSGGGVGGVRRGEGAVSNHDCTPVGAPDATIGAPATTIVGGVGGVSGTGTSIVESLRTESGELDMAIVDGRWVMAASGNAWV